LPLALIFAPQRRSIVSSIAITTSQLADGKEIQQQPVSCCVKWGSASLSVQAQTAIGQIPFRVGQLRIYDDARERFGGGGR